jgi:hypothetical protein
MRHTSSEAKKLYKYQDKNGGWHYSDKAPPTPQSKEFKVEVRQLKVPTKQRVQNNASRHFYPDIYKVFLLRLRRLTNISLKISGYLVSYG